MRRSLTVFFFVLALAAFSIGVLFIFGYDVHQRSAGKLLASADTLSRDHPGIRIMDNALLTLSRAENNFRMFTITYKRNYLQQFSVQLGEVLSSVDVVAGMLAKSPDNQQFEGLVNKKTEVSERIAQMKKATDSMLSTSLTDDRIDKLLSSIPTYKVTQIKKDEVTMDTVSNVQAAPEKKKGFFKRLGNAFSNKNKGDTVKAQMAVLVKTKSGKVIDKETYDAQRMKDIITDVNGYYKKVLRTQLSNRMKIDADEQSLAGTNISMLGELDTLIVALRENAAIALAQQKQQAKTTVYADTSTMRNIAVWGFISLVLAIVMALGTYWLLHKKEVQLKASETAAREQARVRTEFLANMSHEIRTPLNAVVGFSEQLAYSNLSSGQRDLLRSVETSADMLMQVVNDVLDFSKLEKEYISILHEPFSLYDTFEDVINTTRILAVQKNLEFKADFDGEHREVNGDAFRLKQILLNLISNAVKYTPSGSVTVTGILEIQSDKQGLFTFRVKDTGEGISKEAQANLFERFYQAVPARVTVKGTGLGLAITKKLVEMHGGNISFTSEPGQGTEFICQIPYELASGEAHTTITVAETEQPVGAFMEGRYILVAEDQEMNLLLMKMMLTRWKCRFDMARDGETALRLLEQHRYDLVLLDLHMPKFSGLEVVERIRKDADPQKAGVVVLALTADITEQDVRDFRRAGFNDWLMKPFKEMDIYRVIRKNLRLGEKVVPEQN
ncbi:His Kinase A (phospho-acceptor) domain-containing protein [Chitinophaga eiseniae]|uniref:histidine kinase n=1 Tax=Chitinophaga eiseniae TaxID=634771 RepID=A0A1T4TTQ9_9BACT|nr:ATP-binding protein [Chitinophaga eiseniae]SKA43579.1 His Kinase A (phospho-acceptor) domain-containing protein [Chitinophaga eiseniae]